MAADVTSVEAGSTPAAPNQVQLTPSTAPQHRVRFLLIYGTLGGVLVAAIVGIVVFAGRSFHPAPAWSSWKPKGGGLGAAQEIADHVGMRYRLQDGSQLVDVIPKAPSVSPPTAGTIPIHYIAVRGTKGAMDQVYSVSPSNSVMYSLCGLGASCSIATGTPSVARGRLVRREILELALYTFKYVDGIQSVLAFMPPKGATGKRYVVYLRQSDVTAALKQPLAKTLVGTVPRAATISAQETRVIEAVTAPRLYTFGIAQAPQGDLVFVLAPAA